MEHKDFRNILIQYDTPETFFYLDLLYISSTRSSTKYKCEIDDKDYKDMVDIILKVQRKVMLSGYYDGEIYKTLEEKGWKKVSFDVSCSLVGKNKIIVSGDGKIKKIDNKIRNE